MIILILRGDEKRKGGCCKMKRPKDLPKIGMHYNCYDDGKISVSRCYDVEVTDIVPFSRASQDILDLWDMALENDCDLYAESTDYFIKAISFEWTNNPLETIFVRTKEGYWFSLGMMAKDEYGAPFLSDWLCCGLLDVDGKFTGYLKEK